MRIALICYTLALAHPAAAADVAGWVAVCSEPHGDGYEFGDLKSFDNNVLRSTQDGFVRQQDSSTGVYPTFFFAGGDSRGVLVDWGNTKPDGVPLEWIPPTRIIREAIIARSDSGITTIGVYGGETWMTTFVPRFGIAFSTRQKVYDFEPQGTLVTSTTFNLRCRFGMAP